MLISVPQRAKPRQENAYEDTSRILRGGQRGNQLVAAAVWQAIEHLE